MRCISLASIVIAGTLPAAAGMERCLIEVDGRALLFGRCHVDREEGGALMVGVGANGAKPSPIFAYVYPEGDGARGTWNETAGSTHAHAELGTLKKSGGCWLNERAKVCAWK